MLWLNQSKKKEMWHCSKVRIYEKMGFRGIEDTINVFL